MSKQSALERRLAINKQCLDNGLLDYDKLMIARIINTKNKTICPLCLEELSAQGFFSKIIQAKGRLVPDLTVTELNLFHIEELQTGKFNHRPYNIGWGHHHCNMVVKNSGILETVRWMKKILENNKFHELSAS